MHIETQWFTPPREAQHYYGPNQALRQFLQQNPKSWKTVHREVTGNDLVVSVTGGTVLKNYPLIIQAQNPNQITIHIKGGVGYVPIRIEGLSSSHGYKFDQIIAGKPKPLNQSIHGNDYWQCEYDLATKRYKLTFNVPLDGKPESYWQLNKVP